jgi:hypothetical protein
MEVLSFFCVEISQFKNKTTVDIIKLLVLINLNSRSKIKSVFFCRQTLTLLSDNIVNPSLIGLSSALMSFSIKEGVPSQ